MTLRLNYRIYHRVIHIIIWVNTWLHIYLNLFNNTHIIIIFRELYASSPSAEQVQPLLHYLAINCIIIRRAKIAYKLAIEAKECYTHNMFTNSLNYVL